MSKIKNSRLDQYGAEPFEQQQFGTAGVERVNVKCIMRHVLSVLSERSIKFVIDKTILELVKQIEQSRQMARA